MSTHVPLHPQELLRRVADAHFCATKDVLSHSRLKEAARARVLLYLLLHEECRWSPALIAAKMGRDRSTVRSGLVQARERLQTPDGTALYRAICGRDPTRDPESRPIEDREPASQALPVFQATAGHEQGRRP